MHEAEFKADGLVLMGHGTTLNADSAAPVFQHAAELRRRSLFREVREGFWKQEPKVEAVLASMQSTRVYIVPVFISEGYFSEQVIPKALGFASPSQDTETSKPDETGRESFNRILRQSSRVLVYCRPLGTHESMTGVLLARAREVVSQFPFPRQPPMEEVSLFIAGHGTGQNDQSRVAIERQVELIRAMNLFAAVHAMFMEEDPPIAACYELAPTRNIVVVPFFISDGLHVKEDIPVLLGEPEQRVKERLGRGLATWRNPSEKRGKLVWYSPAVGSEPRMAEVILERVREGARWVDRAASTTA